MAGSTQDVRRTSPPRTDSSRVPPNDLAAEESLLGAMLLNRDAISACVGVVHSDDFYKPSHAHIFDAIMSLTADNQPADPVTVADTLRRADVLDAIGGPSTLTSLQANTPAIASAERYARIVSDHAALRRLIGAAGEIAEDAYSMPDDVPEAIDRAESLVFQIGERRAASTVSPISEELKRALDRLEMLYDRKESITGVPTGYNDLDELLSGLQPENLIVVGARPAMGKTAFALGMARNAAIEGNKAVLFCSLEMGTLELTQRLLAAEARVDAERMRTGKLAESDWGKINHAIGRLGQAPIFLDDNPNLTVMDLRAKARRLSSKLPNGLGLIIIDYLQLMSSSRRNSESRTLEVGEMSRGLKILARELKVPVVALSQLSRNLESRQDKRPMLSDLRESGCLAYDTLITRADTGEHVTIGSLAQTGARDIPVWSVNSDGELVVANMSRAFSSGVKETFALRLASGRVVQASANHPFLTDDGWKALGDLSVGNAVAIPAAIPPATVDAWLPDHEVILLAHLLGSCGATTCSMTAEGLARCDSLQYASDDLENLVEVENAVRAFGLHARRVWLKGSWGLTVAPVSELHSQSEHPIVLWLRELGVNPLDSAGVRAIPAVVQALGDAQIALFLHHFGRCDASRRGVEAWDRTLKDDGSQLNFSFDALAPRSFATATHAAQVRQVALDLQQLYARIGVQTAVVAPNEAADSDADPHWVLAHVNPIEIDAFDNATRDEPMLGNFTASGRADSQVVDLTLGSGLSRPASGLDTSRPASGLDTSRPASTAAQPEGVDGPAMRPSSMLAVVDRPTGARSVEAGLPARSLAAAEAHAASHGLAINEVDKASPFASRSLGAQADVPIKTTGAGIAWDAIVAIEALGPLEVFDATVDVTHNFLANGVVVHNSIEQDADVVMFLYRDEVYNMDSPDKGMAEIIVSKHRNGPTGQAKLAFLSSHTSFVNMAK